MSTNEIVEEKTIDEQLNRFRPIRVVIRRQPSGEIEGLVEHSFSMGWSTTVVNIFWSGKAYSMLGEHQLDGISIAESNARGMQHGIIDLFNPENLVIDPFDQDCPIEIDWKRWLSAKGKFDQRNAPFKMKVQS